MDFLEKEITLVVLFLSCMKVVIPKLWREFVKMQKKLYYILKKNCDHQEETIKKSDFIYQQIWKLDFEVLFWWQWIHSHSVNIKHWSDLPG